MNNGMFGLIGKMAIKTKGLWRAVTLDAITHAIVGITQGHHEVHAGHSHWINYSATLANGDVMRVAFTTPTVASGKLVHLTLTVSSTDQGTFTIEEGLTSYSGGAASPTKNRYRDKQTTDPSLVTTPVSGRTGASPITLAGGSNLFTDLLLSNKGIVWERRSGEEVILKAENKYCFTVTNGVNANTVSIVLEWYEHINRD